MQAGREQVHGYLKLLRFNLSEEARNFKVRDEFCLWATLVVSVCLLLAGFLLFAVAAFGEPSDSALADAIYRAEGGVRAQYPYGVRSIDTHGDAAYARRITLNSIRNNRRRWETAGNPGSFLEFMARRWAPVGAGNDPDGLNRHFVKNVRFFLGAGK